MKKEKAKRVFWKKKKERRKEKRKKTEGDCVNSVHYLNPKI